jgi:hypothetical protein
MPQTRLRRSRNRYTRRSRKQSGGAEHIYTIPLKSMFDVVYALGSELMNLRSQCVSKCVEKLCTPRGDPVLCEQSRRVIQNKSVGEFATALCHNQLVRMTDVSGTACQRTPAPTDCVCDQFAKKYLEMERIAFDLDKFISNYHIDSPVKQYIMKIRDATRTILAVMDNFHMETSFKRIAEDQHSKSINDIMQTTEFKNALRTAVAPRPVSAPPAVPTSPVLSRLEAAGSGATRRLFVPAPTSAPALMESSRLLNTMKPMNV